MSVIKIETNQPEAPAALVMRVRTALGCSLADARSVLAGAAPLFESEIFDNRFDELKVQLRELLAALESAAVPMAVSEDGSEITPEILRNILDSADEEYERQLSQP